jgi:hypothetical protein
MTKNANKIAFCFDSELMAESKCVKVAWLAINKIKFKVKASQGHG